MEPSEKDEKTKLVFRFDMFPLHGGRRCGVSMYLMVCIYESRHRDQEQ
jgi:hypothetical protein